MRPAVAVALSALACQGPSGGDDTGSPYTVDPSDRCAFIQATVGDAGFDAAVSVTCSAALATFVTRAYPDHDLMNGITSTNLQIPVPSEAYEVPIPLEPAPASAVTSIDNAVAIAVNGVPIYDYSSQGTIDPSTYDPAVDTALRGELDLCGGHAGRGDDYHYHVAPTCMIEAMDNPGDGAILGWAFDGYPLYGDANPDGSAIGSGDLDDCNGQDDDTFGYRYHTSDDPPYIVQCLTGAVDLDLYSPVPPLDAQGGGGGRPLGSLPSGGDPVDDLTHVKESGGGATMTFSQQSVDMSIAYTPASTTGCYDFVIDTNDGEVSGTYCR